MRQNCSEAANRIYAVGGRGMRPRVVELPWETRLRERWRRLTELQMAIAKAQQSYNEQRAQLLAIGARAFEEAVPVEAKR
jgi:hypothetical protein